MNIKTSTFLFLISYCATYCLLCQQNLSWAFRCHSTTCLCHALQIGLAPIANSVLLFASSKCGNFARRNAFIRKLNAVLSHPIWCRSIEFLPRFEYERRQWPTKVACFTSVIKSSRSSSTNNSNWICCIGSGASISVINSSQNSFHRLSRFQWKNYSIISCYTTPNALLIFVKD